MEKIFLDNASTTQINEQVNQLIFDINKNCFYNPSAMYHDGVNVLDKINMAKKTLASFLNCESENIIFTSGATESNNLAVIGSITGKKDAEYIFSSGEHPSVYNVAKNLEQKGCIVKFIKLNSDGIIDIEHLKTLLNENTHFVSIMYVSNETGAINDIEAISKIIKNNNNKTIIHCDAVQAFCKLDCDIKKLGVDALSISAHKFHGPKGVGALYYKNIKTLKPIILGGGQQNNLRSGTENVSGILGLVLASEIMQSELKQNYEKMQMYRNIFKTQIEKDLSGKVEYMFNESENNSPYILSVSFKNLKSEVLMHILNDNGVIIGTGSACSSKKEGNRILENMNKPKEFIKGNIRISFSSFNTLEEVKKASEVLTNCVLKLNEQISR